MTAAGNPLSAALDDPELQALGDDQITNFLTQRQAQLRTQLLDVTVGMQLLAVTTDRAPDQKDAELANLQKQATSLRATIELVGGALAAPAPVRRAAPAE